MSEVESKMPRKRKLNNMKALTLFIISISSGYFSFAQIDAVDEAKIKEVAQNYLDGWYEGDASKMASALHADLIKRIQADFKPSGGQVINSISKSQLIEMTKAGFGKSVPREKLTSEVTVLSVFKDIATVEAISFQYVDYFHLVKTSDGWKILNILWTAK